MPLLQIQARLHPPRIDLTGKVAIVTGANAGIGLETVRQLLLLNAATVVLAVRSIENGEAAKSLLLADRSIRSVKKAPDIRVMKLDMADYQSAWEFANRIKVALPALHILILSAAVANLPWSKTSSGHDQITQVNYFSNVLLLLELLPLLEASARRAGEPFARDMGRQPGVRGQQAREDGPSREGAVGGAVPGRPEEPRLVHALPRLEAAGGRVRPRVLQASGRAHGRRQRRVSWDGRHQHRAQRAWISSQADGGSDQGHGADAGARGVGGHARGGRCWAWIPRPVFGGPEGDFVSVPMARPAQGFADTVTLQILRGAAIDRGPAAPDAAVEGDGGRDGPTRRRAAPVHGDLSGGCCMTLQEQGEARGWDIEKEEHVSEIG